MSDFDRQPGESTQAHHAFTVFRSLGVTRSLRAVSEALARERRGSGIRFVSDERGNDGATIEPRNQGAKRSQHSGRVGLWSRQYRWQERAKAWDEEIARHLCTQQKHEIEAMAKRQARQAALAIESLLQPVAAFVKAMVDPTRRAAFEHLSAVDLFKMAVSSCSVLPRMFAAETLARGCTVVLPGTVAGSSPQGPAEWRVSVYQPPREQALPTQQDIAQMSADEWEEAEVGR